MASHRPKSALGAGLSMLATPSPHRAAATPNTHRTISVARPASFSSVATDTSRSQYRRHAAGASSTSTRPRRRKTLTGPPSALQVGQDYTRGMDSLGFDESQARRMSRFDSPMLQGFLASIGSQHAPSPGNKTRRASGRRKSTSPTARHNPTEGQPSRRLIVPNHPQRGEHGTAFGAPAGFIVDEDGNLVADGSSTGPPPTTLFDSCGNPLRGRRHTPHIKQSQAAMSSHDTEIVPSRRGKKGATPRHRATSDADILPPARDDPNSRRRTRRHLRAPAVQSLTNNALPSPGYTAAELDVTVPSPMTATPRRPGPHVSPRDLASGAVDDAIRHGRPAVFKSKTQQAAEASRRQRSAAAKRIKQWSNRQLRSIATHLRSRGKDGTEALRRALIMAHPEGKVGSLSVPQFQAALSRCGFQYTTTDATMLARELSRGSVGQPHGGVRSTASAKGGAAATAREQRAQHAKQVLYGETVHVDAGALLARVEAGHDAGRGAESAPLGVRDGPVPESVALGFYDGRGAEFGETLLRTANGLPAPRIKPVKVPRAQWQHKLVDIYGRVAHSRGKMDASLASALSKVTLKTTGALQSEEVDTSGVEEALAGVAADLRRKVQDKLPRDSATRAVVVRTFLRKNDHDHDGRLSAGEVRRALEPLDLHLSPAEVDLIMHAVDQRGDDPMSWEGAVASTDRLESRDVNADSLFFWLTGEDKAASKRPPTQPPSRRTTPRGNGTPVNDDTGRSTWASARPTTFEQFSVMWQAKHGAAAAKEAQIDARFNVPSLGVASSYAIKQPFKVMHPSFQAPPSGVKPMAPPPPPTP